MLSPLSAAAAVLRGVRLCAAAAPSTARAPLSYLVSPRPWLLPALRPSPVGCASAPPNLYSLHRSPPARGLKSRSSMKKRFRVRSGVVVRLQCGKRHLNMHKSRSHVNRLVGTTTVPRALQSKYLKLVG